MNGLAEEDDLGNWSLKGVKWEQLHEGSTITRELWRKLYGALWKLMEYEDTGMNPDDVINSYEYNKIIKIMSKNFNKERIKRLWHGPEDNKLKKMETILVTVKRHRWIADYYCDLVPESEKTEHKEAVYVTLGRRTCTGWEYMDLEDYVWDRAIFLDNDLKDKILAEPITEIVSWKPLPEVDGYEKIIEELAAESKKVQEEIEKRILAEEGE